MRIEGLRRGHMRISKNGEIIRNMAGSGFKHHCKKENTNLDVLKDSLRKLNLSSSTAKPKYISF